MISEGRTLWLEIETAWDIHFVSKYSRTNGKTEVRECIDEDDVPTPTGTWKAYLLQMTSCPARCNAYCSSHLGMHVNLQSGAIYDRGWRRCPFRFKSA